MLTPMPHTHSLRYVFLFLLCLFQVFTVLHALNLCLRQPASTPSTSCPIPLSPTSSSEGANLLVELGFEGIIRLGLILVRSGTGLHD